MHRAHVHQIVPLLTSFVVTQMTEALDQFKHIEAEEKTLQKKKEEEIKAAAREIRARYEEQRMQVGARKKEAIVRVNLYAQTGSNEHLITGMEAARDTQEIEAEETELYKKEEKEKKAAVWEITARYKDQKMQVGARKKDAIVRVNCYARTGSNGHMITRMEAARNTKEKEHARACYFGELLHRVFQPKDPSEYCGAVIPLKTLGNAFFNGLTTVQKYKKEAGKQVVMDPEMFLADVGSFTRFTKILCMLNNIGVAYNLEYFDYNGKQNYLPTTRIHNTASGQIESKNGMFVRVVKTLTHRDIPLSPFMTEKANETLNEERECERLMREKANLNEEMERQRLLTKMALLKLTKMALLGILVLIASLLLNQEPHACFYQALIIIELLLLLLKQV